MGHRFNPKLLHRLESPERKQWMQPDRLLDFLELTGSEDVADIGAGTGFLSIPVAQRTSGRVFAVDVSPEMLEYLRGKLVHQEVSNVIPLLGPAEQLPLHNESVDCLICSLVLHEVDDIDRALAEFQRTLRPGGRALLIEWFPRVTEHGPPLEERLDPVELERRVRQAGFACAIHDANDNQYAIVGVSGRPDIMG